VHLAVVDRMLERIGCTEADLACGPHPPLGLTVAREVTERRTTLTPRWSNCSGKHAGMLALARHHGWPTQGYEVSGHPVQDRLLQSVAKWTGVAADGIWRGVDGCTTVCYGLPLRNMALAYARFATTADPAAVTVRDAMLAQPRLIAGEGRLCTDLMRVAPGRIIAKIGAEGVYCVAIPGTGLGIALKVEDGDMRSCVVALMGLLRRLGAGVTGLDLPENGPLAAHDRFPIHNTRGVATGELRSAGAVRFSAPS
jgi:L-asparaginase II